MKKPQIKMNCKEISCCDCVLSSKLCSKFEYIVDRLNDIISIITETEVAEEQKVQIGSNVVEYGDRYFIEVKPGDKVQVSNDNSKWYNRYHVGIGYGAESYVFIAAAGVNPDGSFNRMDTWKYCRLYKK